MAELSNKRLASNQRRKLNSIKESINKMAGDWGDVDNYFESKLDSLAKEVESMEAEMIEFINEPN